MAFWLLRPAAAPHAGGHGGAHREQLPSAGSFGWRGLIDPGILDGFDSRSCRGGSSSAWPPRRRNFLPAATDNAGPPTGDAPGFSDCRTVATASGRVRPPVASADFPAPITA